MAEHFLVRFTKTHHIETDAGVAGWSPAIIKTDGVEKPGRVFKPTKANSGMYSEQLAELRFPVRQLKPTPLDRLLKKTRGGKAWLKSFRDNLKTQYSKTVDPFIEIRINEFIMQHRYTLYPDDQSLDMREPSPGGLLLHMPITAVFAWVNGAFTFGDGQHIPNLYYRRRVVGANKEVMSYTIKPDTDSVDFDGSSILGKAGEDDITVLEQAERLKGFFPAYHSVEMTWPTHIHAPEKIRPVTISVTMVM